MSGSFYGSFVFMIIVYGIVNCDMVKCVCVWLVEWGYEVVFYDFKK